MLLKPKKPKQVVPDEGEHAAAFEKFTLFPDEANPKKIILDFRVAGYEECVAKDIPISFEEGSQFIRDMETLRGAPFTTAELQGGFDPSAFLGAKVRLIVVLRPGAGGKMRSVAGPFTAIPCENKAK